MNKSNLPRKSKPAPTTDAHLKNGQLTKAAAYKAHESVRVGNQDERRLAQDRRDAKARAPESVFFNPEDMG